MPEVRIPTALGNMPAWLAAPPQGGPWPGVIVLFDMQGMSPDMRNQAAWLAGEGFLAAVPDLYHWGGKFTCIRSVIRDLLAGRGRAFDEVEAVRAWLSRQADCNGRVGVIGYCMGGGFALLLAPGHGFSASSINYGGPIPKNAETLLAGACPIVGSYGARDRWARGAAADLDRVLTALRVDHDVKEYPDAGHSFLNNHQNVLFKMLKVIGVAYHEPSARDARRRIAAFLRTHLTPIG